MFCALSVLNSTAINGLDLEVYQQNILSANSQELVSNNLISMANKAYINMPDTKKACEAGL
ncbi:hypothetical protein TUM4438_03730 [Shewanella sairae]|uniref:Uncharacterized protein n=1 Tax=Shewanella sairae TaxID=190310 RepID=A0ABQ4P0R1_9GAMM|nr:hypothetical protein TUM4438_03730 [Shewanella sairae]